MAYQTYTVQPGDSLSKIAQKLGLSSWQDLYNLNRSIVGANPNLIYSGQVLNIPGTEATPTTTVSAPTPVPTQQPTAQSIAEQYTQSIRDQAAKIASIPTFQQALPFEDAWRGMVPQATAAAASQIDPELMRNYKGQYLDYMTGMASSGGGRFGRGLAGVGDLKAATERSRNAQLQDWLSQYQQGYRSLFYDPAREAWDTSRTQGKAPDQGLTKIPTWEDLYTKFQNVYGVGETPSPLYG